MFTSKLPAIVYFRACRCTRCQVMESLLKEIGPDREDGFSSGGAKGIRGLSAVIKHLPFTASGPMMIVLDRPGSYEDES